MELSPLKAGHTAEKRRHLRRRRPGSGPGSSNQQICGGDYRGGQNGDLAANRRRFADTLLLLLGSKIASFDTVSLELGDEDEHRASKPYGGDQRSQLT